MYTILITDEKGKECFYPEIYRTKAEAEATLEIMAETDERVMTVVEAFE